jgi:hypothetical protein
VEFGNVASGKKESLDSNGAMEKDDLPRWCKKEERVLGFCNAHLGTEESNKAELPLDKDCLTLELEDLHLINFHNDWRFRNRGFGGS